MTSRWYVVQSKQKQELSSAQQLENQGFSVFVPQHVVKKLSRGNPVQVAYPLFPSYLFVEFDITKDRWRCICSTKGVQQLVTATDESVTPLPRGFVEDMMMETDGNGYILLKKADEVLAEYSPGDELSVASGIFEGLSGTCERVKKDKVVVLLTLLSGKTRVELPTVLVSRANQHDGGSVLFCYPLQIKHKTSEICLHGFAQRCPE